MVGRDGECTMYVLSSLSNEWKNCMCWTFENFVCFKLDFRWVLLSENSFVQNIIEFQRKITWKKLKKSCKKCIEQMKINLRTENLNDYLFISISIVVCELAAVMTGFFHKHFTGFFVLCCQTLQSNQIERFIHSTLFGLNFVGFWFWCGIVNWMVSFGLVFFIIFYHRKCFSGHIQFGWSARNW